MVDTEAEFAELAGALRRTSVPGWGADYRPALRSTRDQAPSAPRVSMLRSTQIGREVHALSTGEKEFALLALHHNRLFDLHEQCPLARWPNTHPLQSHPVASGMQLPPTRGTLEIADALGLLAHHPKRRVQAPMPADTAQDDQDWDLPGDRLRNSYFVPVSWIGDLLLFLVDHEGPFAVHWDVKAKAGDHSRPGPRRDERVASERSIRRAAARFEVQQRYFEQLGIRSICLARGDIDAMVASNLRMLFGWTLQPPALSQGHRRQVVEGLKRALIEGNPPIEACSKLSLEIGCALSEAKRVFFQAVWSRQLRVDLFQPILIDRPMHAERRDVLVVYGDWFRR